MENSDKLRKGLKCCKATTRGITVKDCDIDCPYFHEGVFCKNALHKDALAYIQQLESSRWELFDDLSTAYYGKMMYCLNDDGTVYSRYSCDTMSFEQAVDEFRRLIADE